MVPVVFAFLAVALVGTIMSVASQAESFRGTPLGHDGLITGLHLSFGGLGGAGSLYLNSPWSTMSGVVALIILVNFLVLVAVRHKHRFLFLRLNLWGSRDFAMATSGAQVSFSTSAQPDPEQTQRVVDSEHPLDEVAKAWLQKLRDDGTPAHVLEEIELYTQNWSEKHGDMMYRNLSPEARPLVNDFINSLFDGMEEDE